MKIAFIDTSALAAILFKESKSSVIQDILADFEMIYASNLLEAEMRGAAARENSDPSELESILSRVEWVLPDRPLSQELRSVASAYPLKGADSWHLACALYLAGDPSVLPLITLDEDQALAASRLGFKVMPQSPGAGPVLRESPSAYRTVKPKAKAGKKK